MGKPDGDGGERGDGSEAAAEESGDEESAEEAVTGRKIERLYMLNGGTKNVLLNSFITNALQIPVVIVPEDAAALGNILVQAIALGQLSSLEEARRIVRESSRFETIQPSAVVWNTAFERLEKLT